MFLYPVCLIISSSFSLEIFIERFCLVDGYISDGDESGPEGAEGGEKQKKKRAPGKKREPRPRKERKPRERKAPVGRGRKVTHPRSFLDPPNKFTDAFRFCWFRKSNRRTTTGCPRRRSRASCRRPSSPRLLRQTATTTGRRSRPLPPRGATTATGPLETVLVLVPARARLAPDLALGKVLGLVRARTARRRAPDRVPGPTTRSRSPGARGRSRQRASRAQARALVPTRTATRTRIVKLALVLIEKKKMTTRFIVSFVVIFILYLGVWVGRFMYKLSSLLLGVFCQVSKFIAHKITPTD